MTKKDGGFHAEHTTDFFRYDMDELKAMVANADPGAVHGIAMAWKKISEWLVGPKGGGGLKKEFDDAIDEVLEHWGGKAAQGFREYAKKISQNIANAAPYADNMQVVMEGVSKSLSDYKEKVDAMQKPTGTESNMDAVGNYALKVVTFGQKGGRDDTKANNELSSGKSTQAVLDGNSGELSEGKERQLQTAIIMEHLGASYRSSAASIGKPPVGQVGEREVPPRDDTLPPPPFVPLPDSVVKPPRSTTPSTVVPSGKGPGYKSPGAVEAPRQLGISGGVGSTPKTLRPSQLPSIGTGLDGLPGTPPGGDRVTPTIPGGSPGVPGVPGGGGNSGGQLSPGQTNPGVPGMPVGRVGSVGGLGAGGRTARPGMPGGAGGGAGIGRVVGGAGAMGGGALGRKAGIAAGSTVGSPSGSGAQGGSGLHRSRGGTQAGEAAGQRATGMAGAPGAHGGKAKDRGPNGERPDYLVEDEETWTPERNVAPKVIE
ncbi:hypothetical protein [Streptomyces sp. NPDC003077]|uniref:hypothetical protein n=1 Tax=Streptomyces sp. NPDC003077 TaxID=3154443 RepID=UPI0033A1EAA6